MAATPEHGKNAEIWLDDSGDTLTDLKALAQIRDLEFPEELQSLESTGFGDSDREYIQGLSGKTITVQGLISGDIESHVAGVRTTEDLDFRIRPFGTAVGRVEFTGKCFISGWTYPMNFEALTPFTLTLQVDGTVTRATQ